MKDHLGNIKVTVDQTGSVASYDDYDPFGMGLEGRSGNISGIDTRFKFTSKERDTETNYDYFGARYYYPLIGRWMSVDPLAEKHPSLSPYVYVGNNPMAFVDPTGMDSSQARQTPLPTPPPPRVEPIPIVTSVSRLLGRALGVLGMMLIPETANKNSETRKSSDQSPTSSQNQPQKTDESGTAIYRIGSGSNQNLTPREKDVVGLSYTLIEPQGVKYTTTTLEAVNATGILRAAVDNPSTGHVSIGPTDRNRMGEWISSRPNAETQPHHFTTLLRDISIKK